MSKEGHVMPAYISLLRYKQEGIRDIEKSPACLDAATQYALLMRGPSKELYLVTERNDGMCGLSIA